MQPFAFLQPSSLTVSELTRYLRDLLESDDLLREVWVQGEISNFSRPPSGHLYFTLKDSGAALRCVIWKGTALRLRIGMQNGMAIEAHGAIGVYERDGQYQLYIDSVRPAGEGLLYREFLRLKAQLEAEGLFDSERKRSIPERPRCIGIVTSPTGAALQDMLNTLRLRYPFVEVVLAPAAVQGDAAPLEIVRALRCLCAHAQPDVILLARGGGSLEDLWAFNDELVVRAVAASPVPVITGVGHETDFTLVDFACDLRAPTPTGAAVLATPDRSDLYAELGSAASRLGSATLGLLETFQQDLADTAQRLERASPVSKIHSGQQAVDDAVQRVARAFSHELQLHRLRMGGLQSRLIALNPAAVLRRGYAIVQDPSGALVNSVGEVSVGSQIQVLLRDGALHAEVKDVKTGATDETRSH